MKDRQLATTELGMECEEEKSTYDERKLVNIITCDLQEALGSLNERHLKQYHRFMTEDETLRISR